MTRTVLLPSDITRAHRRKLARDACHGVIYMLAIVGLAAVGQLCSGCATPNLEPWARVMEVRLFPAR